MITLSRHDVYMLAGGLQIAAQQCTDRDGRPSPAGEHQLAAAAQWWTLHAAMGEDEHVEVLIANGSTRDCEAIVALDEPDEDAPIEQDSAPVGGV